MTVRACRVCGCTETNACVDETKGACWWVEIDLCSHCQSGECAQCGGAPVVTHLDQEKLCKPCADQWCRNEGRAAAETEAEDAALNRLADVLRNSPQHQTTPRGHA